MLKIDKIENIVKEKQCAKIDGFLMDYATANLILRIYKKLKEEDKKKLLAMTPGQAAKICWKMVK